MAARTSSAVIREFRVLFSAGALGGVSDAELLDRFLAARDEAAFAAIVERHGPMVLGVCRRVLHDGHDAEDAFQATFLVLARRAAAVEPKGRLADWLYGVARRVALKARAGSLRRRARERLVAVLPEPGAEAPPARDDVRPLLDEELGRLPEKYRAPIVLCDLQGKTHREAAEQLGWPIGTVSCRISRGRAMLAGRLARRGVSPADASTPLLLSLRVPASAGLPQSLIRTTTRAAAEVAAGKAATVVASTTVAALTKGALRAMLMTRIQIVVAALMAASAGIAGALSPGSGRQGEASSPAASPDGSSPVANDYKDRSSEPSRHSAAVADQELARLEGTWAITDWCEDGAWATAEQKSEGLGKVIFEGDTMTVFSRGDREGSRFTVDVDPEMDPKICSLLLLDDEMKQDMTAPIILGIYKLEGDKLTICSGFDRPDGFEVAPTRRGTCWSFVGRDDSRLLDRRSPASMIVAPILPTTSADRDDCSYRSLATASGPAARGPSSGPRRSARPGRRRGPRRRARPARGAGGRRRSGPSGRTAGRRRR